MLQAITVAATKKRKGFFIRKTGFRMTSEGAGFRMTDKRAGFGMTAQNIAVAGVPTRDVPSPPTAPLTDALLDIHRSPLTFGGFGVIIIV